MGEYVDFEDPEDRLRMTPEQWEWFKRRTRGFREQDENGIDLSLLRANLKLSPEERLLKHERSLRNLLEFERAAERAGLRPDPHPPRG